MAGLVEEVKVWNTPLIGAFLLWRFTDGYIASHENARAPLALNHFIAMGILTSKVLLDPISDRRPNLQSYVRSFEDNSTSDVLLSIHDRIKEKLSYTWKSIDIAVANGLLFWDVENGQLYPAQDIQKPKRGSSIRRIHNKNGLKAEILGKWFAQHDLTAITKYLKIVL